MKNKLIFPAGVEIILADLYPLQPLLNNIDTYILKQMKLNHVCKNDYEIAFKDCLEELYSPIDNMIWAGQDVYLAHIKNMFKEIKRYTMFKTNQYHYSFIPF